MLRAPRQMSYRSFGSHSWNEAIIIIIIITIIIIMTIVCVGYLICFKVRPTGSDCSYFGSVIKTYLL